MLFHVLLAFVSAAESPRLSPGSPGRPLIELRTGLLIDAHEQRLAVCAATDPYAWERAVLECEKRALQLCSFEEYEEAYTTALMPPQAYAFSRTTDGCGPDRHALLAWGGPYLDELDGCHTNRGCWPDRYFRCCGTL